MRPRVVHVLAVAVSDVATSCDDCGGPIRYEETCYQVPTSETWTGDDVDYGAPIVRVVCASCYDGPAVGTTPRKVALR
jgi:hypothetical protein